MAILVPLLIIIAIILGVGFYFDPKRRGPGRLPPIYGSIPIWGSMVEFSKDTLGTVKRAHEKLGDCFTLHLAGFNMTFLVGIEAQTAFFKASDEELSQREAYRFTTPVFGEGVVFDSPTGVMYEQMKFIKSGLVIAQLRKHVNVIEAETRVFLDGLGKSGEIDMLNEMNRLTILTASASLLGDEIRHNPDVAAKFADYYHDLEGGLNPIAFLFPNFPMEKHRIRDRARIAISELFMDIIKKRRAMPESERKDRDDMIQVLMDSEYKEGGAPDDKNITGLLIALLFAGQHTSGITSSWTGFFLLQNPKWMQACIQEQKEIVEQDGRAINFDTLRKSVKLEACVREALRMYPPLIMLMRKVKKAFEYKGMTVPEGDFVCVAPAYSMRLPEIYSNPNTFDPSRFERGEDKDLPYAYIAFGGGRHGCPGENFGITQIKTVWTVLLREYELEMGDQGFPRPDYESMVVGPAHPCKIKFRKRDVPLC